jgi:hypothetical protein
MSFGQLDGEDGTAAMVTEVGESLAEIWMYCYEPARFAEWVKSQESEEAKGHGQGYGGEDQEEGVFASEKAKL